MQFIPLANINHSLSFLVITPKPSPKEKGVLVYIILADGIIYNVTEFAF